MMWVGEFCSDGGWGGGALVRQGLRADPLDGRRPEVLKSQCSPHHSLYNESEALQSPNRACQYGLHCASVDSGEDGQVGRGEFFRGTKHRLITAAHSLHSGDSEMLNH